MRKRFTDSEAAEIAKIYLAGSTMKDIQVAYGLPNYGSIVTALISQGVERRDKLSILKRFSLEEEIEICALYKSGKGSSAISEIFYGDRSGTQTIINILSRYGIEIRTERAGICDKCGTNDRYPRGRCKKCSRDKSRQWARDNRERQTALCRKWYVENKDQAFANRHNRIARMSNNGGSHTGKEWVDLVEMYEGTCLRCGRNDVPMTRDHVIPVTSGGSNDIENLQPLCGRCNRGKYTKTIDYRPKQKGRGF